MGTLPSNTQLFYLEQVPSCQPVFKSSKSDHYKRRYGHLKADSGDSYALSPTPHGFLQNLNVLQNVVFIHEHDIVHDIGAPTLPYPTLPYPTYCSAHLYYISLQNGVAHVLCIPLY